MLTPEQIESREFLVSVRGYDRDEVHAFLREAAEQVRALRDQLEAAITDARAAEEMVAEAEAHAQRERARADKAEAALAARPAVVSGDPNTMFAEIGQQTQRILEAAAEAAEGIKAQAKREVEQEIRKARRQADKLIAEGERRREELERGTVELFRKREEVTASLRAVARGLEQSLRDLTLSEPGAATVREAVRGDAREEQPRRRPEPEPEAEPDPAPTAQAEEEVVEGLETETAVQPAQDLAPEAVVGEDAPAAPEAEPEPPVADDPTERPEAPEPRVEEAPVSTVADLGPSDPVTLRAEALDTLHPKVVRKLKRGLQDLQNIAYDRLRATGGSTEPTAVLPPEEEFAPLAESVAEFVEQAYRAGAAAGARLAGRAEPPVTVPDDIGEQFAGDVARQVNGPLAATLRMGMGGREQMSALTDRVAAVFGELKQSVAEEISATHLVRAFEAGMHATWSASGIPARRWVMGREPRCPEARCRTNDQSGAVRLGDPFPSGHAHPPVHAGCTCTTEPVLGGGA